MSRLLVIAALLAASTAVVMLWPAADTHAPKAATNPTTTAEAAASSGAVTDSFNTTRNPDRPTSAGRAPVDSIESVEQAFARSTDLLSFVERWEALGSSDARVARYIAEAMQECLGLGEPQDVAKARAAWSAPDLNYPGQEQARALMGEQHLSRCRNLLSQRHDLPAQITVWRDRAASMNDVISQLRQLRFKHPEQADEAPDLEALGRDLGDLLSLAPQLSGSHEALLFAERLMSPELQRMFPDRHSPMGRMLAQPDGAHLLLACALGMDCSAHSPVLRQTCLYGGPCGYASVQELVARTMMGSDQFARAQQLAQETAAMLRSRDAERLTAPGP